MNFLRDCACLLLLANMATPAYPDQASTFQDTFERTEIGDDWKVIVQHFDVENGRLVGKEDPKRGHGAVIRTYQDFRDAEIVFKFRITNGVNFNLVFNDKNCRDVHAGHISRVSVSTRLIRISDDKNGAMKNEIFAKLRDPKLKLDRRQVLKGTESLISHKLDPKEWHALRVSILGQTLSVELDGRPIGSLTSPGIAHPTKTDFGFTTLGQKVEFDDVQFWRKK